MRRLLVAALACGLLAVPAVASAESVLLTGDSLMENVGEPLGAALDRSGDEVRFDVIAGSGLTLFDWEARAREHMAAVPPPDVVVMFNGSGDVYPLAVGDRMVGCCSAPWRRAYARRAAAVMRTYPRVYWLTLPMPRNRGYANVLAAVNAAVRSAARRVGSSVTLVDLVPVLTPGRRFRRSLGGRVIRRADGIHLTKHGASLVVDEVRRAMAATRRSRTRTAG